MKNDQKDLINSEMIKELLQQKEGVNLEFKQEMYQIFCKAEQGQNIHKGEMIKDILSLANRNVSYVGNTSYLIIGASDSILEDGNRKLFDITDRVPDQKELIQMVNSYCEPKLENLISGIVPIDGINLWVVAIPPTAHLHETIKGMNTQKNQDQSSSSDGSFMKDNEKPWYSSRTVFIRQGEHVRIATMQERMAIETAKIAYINQKSQIQPVIIGVILGAMIGSPLIANSAKLIGVNPTIMFFVGFVFFGLFGGILGNSISDIVNVFYHFSDYSFSKKILFIVIIVICLVVFFWSYSGMAFGK
jgi:hypothetical protein